MKPFTIDFVKLRGPIDCTQALSWWKVRPGMLPDTRGVLAPSIVQPIVSEVDEWHHPDSGVYSWDAFGLHDGPSALAAGLSTAIAVLAAWISIFSACSASWAVL